MTTPTPPTMPKRMHPQKFALWVSIIGMTMLFAALTSAYIVRKAAGNWMEFPLPQEFFYSTAAILSSSIALHLAYRAFRRDDYTAYKTFSTLGFALGILFVVLQYQGWLWLNDNGVLVQTNQSSSFLFLISGLHVLHVLGGIVALAIALVYAFLPKYSARTPKRQLRLELICIYWHFVDALWLYLLGFFFFI